MEVVMKYIEVLFQNSPLRTKENRKNAEDIWNWAYAEYK
jgi:hypothetical protein